MSEKAIESRKVLDGFLKRWSVDKVKSMTLEEYVSTGNKDTFCQWVETKTKLLGGIQGMNSSKFGIYKRGDSLKRPKNLVSDSIYSWQKYYGINREDAFENIKEEILQIIEYSQKGQFEKIDNVHLTSIVKWKIAYLYSNERLIPIFKKSILQKIASSYGMRVNKATKHSEMQKVMISSKPVSVSIYDHADYLYIKYGKMAKKEKVEIPKNRNRTPVESKSTTEQIRKGSKSYVASQKHNLIQIKLKDLLEEIYGVGSAVLEKNYVDVKVVLQNEICLYEVKSSAYASDCVKEALGQILFYACHDADERRKRLFVVGQYAPTEKEIEYINFIKKNLNIEFDYINVSLD